MGYSFLLPTTWNFADLSRNPFLAFSNPDGKDRNKSARYLLFWARLKASCASFRPIAMAQGARGGLLHELVGAKPTSSRCAESCGFEELRNEPDLSCHALLFVMGDCCVNRTYQ